MTVQTKNGVSVGDKVVATGDLDIDDLFIEKGETGTVISISDIEDDDFCYYVEFEDGSAYLEKLEFKVVSGKIKTEFYGKPVKFLGGNDWAHIYQFQDSGYTFLHEPKWNDVGIGILPWRKGRNGRPEFLAVMENRPTHGDEHRLYAITGGYDNPEITTVQTAIKELKEETGYIATELDVIYLGEIYTTKMSTSKMHLFTVNVTSLPQVEKTTDGSHIENTAFPVWVDYGKLVLEGDNLLSKMYNLADVLLAEKGYHYI